MINDTIIVTATNFIMCGMKVCELEGEEEEGEDEETFEFLL